MLQATENDLEQAEILIKHCQGTGEIERKIAERFAELRAEREVVEKKAYDDGQRSMCSTSRINEFLVKNIKAEVYAECKEIAAYHDHYVAEAIQEAADRARRG